MRTFRNDEIMRIAVEQSAKDLNCDAGDFFREENVVVPFVLTREAKKYYKEPIACNFVSYGNNIVAAATGEVEGIVREYLERFEFYHCFETPNLHWLNERLMEVGHKVCFMAEYYLPDACKIKTSSSNYEIRVLEREDFAGLYLPEWGNALCADRKALDVLGVGAYDWGRLVGLAGCSADAEQMWQIGVDVLAEYRRQGIASTLTGALAGEILKRGKVPFYCTAWSNLRSARNAIQCGFLPTWVEMTVKPAETVDRMNQREDDQS